MGGRKTPVKQMNKNHRRNIQCSRNNIRRGGVMAVRKKKKTLKID